MRTLAMPRVAEKIEVAYVSQKNQKNPKVELKTIIEPPLLLRSLSKTLLIM